MRFRVREAQVEAAQLRRLAGLVEADDWDGARRLRRCAEDIDASTAALVREMEAAGPPAVLGRGLAVLEGVS